MGELKNAGGSESAEYEDRLLSENPTEYCKLICQRIAYFLAVQNHYELLKMQAEFVQDENGKMWLVFANRIFIREIQIDNENAPLVFKKVKLISIERKVELESHIKNYSADKSAFIDRISTKMKNYYEDLKQKTGVNVLFDPSPSVGTLSEKFALLRPLMTCREVSKINPIYGKKQKPQRINLKLETSSSQPKLS